MHENPRIGAVYGLASAALFGASIPLAKSFLGAVDPWMLAGLLYLGSGLGLFAFKCLSGRLGRANTEAPLARADLPWLGAVILAGGVAGPVLLMIGLVSTPASTAALLLNLEGLATIVIAWTVFGENFDRRILLGAGAILAGALLLSWQGAAGGVGAGGPVKARRRSWTWTARSALPRIRAGWMCRPGPNGATR